MTNIIGKIAETLGLGDGERNTNAAAAGNGGATEAGGGAGTGGLSTGGGVGGTPDDLAAGLAAAAGAGGGDGQATGGTDPIRAGDPGGSIATGGQGTAGTEPIRPAPADGLLDPPAEGGQARLRGREDDLADLPGQMDGGGEDLRATPAGSAGGRSHDLPGGSGAA